MLFNFGILFALQRLGTFLVELHVLGQPRLGDTDSARQTFVQHGMGSHMQVSAGHRFQTSQAM